MEAQAGLEQRGVDAVRLDRGKISNYRRQSEMIKNIIVRNTNEHKNLMLLICKTKAR
jgi:hypothetical protein